MPVVKLDRIISVSSEDPNYKGENILTSKKWRSKTVGEDQVSIVIQLSKPSLITAIGNFTYLKMTLQYTGCIFEEFASGKVLPTLCYWGYMVV